MKKPKMRKSNIVLKELYAAVPPPSSEPVKIFGGEDTQFTRLKANLHLAWADVCHAKEGLNQMGYQVLIRERSASNPHPDQDGHYQTKFWYDLDVVKVVHQEKPL